MRIKSFALATGFAAASVLGVVGTAGAAAPPELTTEVVYNTLDVDAKRTWDYCLNAKDANGVIRGQGCFAAKGDHVLANDAYADGFWVRTDWHTDYGRDGECEDKGGASGGGNDCNFDMRESGKIKLQVELWDGGTRVAETGWSGYKPIGQ